MRARHVGLRPGLIDEDQTSWIKPALVTLPLGAPAGDVGPLLLAGAQAFFERNAFSQQEVPDRIMADRDPPARQALRSGPAM